MHNRRVGLIIPVLFAAELSRLMKNELVKTLRSVAELKTVAPTNFPVTHLLRLGYGVINKNMSGINVGFS